MTRQEAQLIDDLFDRLAKLESAPRDAAAERQISDGLQRAPHAVYALVQTALVQDEALRRANARIEELEAQTAGEQAQDQRPASFLDAMREVVTGRAAGRVSVPSVRPSGNVQQQNLEYGGAQPQNFQPQGREPQPGYPPPPSGYPGGPSFGSGGSFLGTAASTAAGVIGGSLLLNSIRSMFGQHAASYGSISSGRSGGDSSSPWSNTADPSAGKSDLARDLGADQISNQGFDEGKRGDVESVADTDEDYDANDNDNDNDDADDDFDAGDSDGDSYDV